MKITAILKGTGATTVVACRMRADIIIAGRDIRGGFSITANCGSCFWR